MSQKAQTKEANIDRSRHLHHSDGARPPNDGRSGVPPREPPQTRQFPSGWDHEADLEDPDTWEEEEAALAQGIKVYAEVRPGLVIVRWRARLGKAARRILGSTLTALGGGTLVMIWLIINPF